MTLNQTGKRLLASFWRVPTTLKFTGTLTHTRTVTFTYSKIDSLVTYRFYTSSGYTIVQSLTITRLPARATVELRCRGGGCPFARRVLKPRESRLSLTSQFARARLAPRATLRVDITARDRVGKAVIFTMRNTAPTLIKRCMPPVPTTPWRANRHTRGAPRVAEALPERMRAS